MNKIYVKWCTAGHTVCRYHPVKDERCPDCDKPFYETCRQCGQALPSEDVDTGYARGQKVPDKVPARPERCPRCRWPHPWNRDRRVSLADRVRSWFLK